MGNQNQFGNKNEIRLCHLHQSGSLLFQETELKTISLSKPSSGRSPENNPVHLRLADQSDIPFIAGLSRELFSIYGPYDRIVPSWLGLDSTVTVIAQTEKLACGFAMIGDLCSRYDLKSASELLAIGVEPVMQQNGIGKKLIKEMEKRAIRLGIKRLFLHTATENVEARRLFTRNSYRPWEIKKDFYPAGQDAVVMSKEI